ncbi:hydroxypyruvate reductase [Shimia gijangensis]|uniref:Hydroxypyruvate reductase n=1 Tax=Shimia gijangensis TaxID=1470563 RepID=A0A1M6CX24_9RHOB|nr:D-glycerate dehydrogenase [Shimia gijangensis]SHI65298.1 hydroxypyruvate reductase [Shimia gijangensis]
MKTLLVTRPLPQTILDNLAYHYEVSVRDRNTPLTDEELRNALRGFDAVLPTLGDMFEASVFFDVPNPKCRILANFGVGFNHIDAKAAAEFGIAVTNTPGAVTDATADIAMTLMLMSARRAGEGERLVRSGQWTGWHPTQMLGMHLSGKTVGIVGMGRIGQAIAQRCFFGFGMRVQFVNRSPRRMEFDTQQVETIEKMAGQVDVLVAAIPGGPETRHLIGQSVLNAMQPHSYFINISRGDVVDEAALVEALENGSIAGAGLDVYENEPVIPEALKTLENVTLLPHLGTAALEVRVNMGQMAVNNLEAFAEGRKLPNRVN